MMASTRKEVVEKVLSELEKVKKPILDILGFRVVEGSKGLVSLDDVYFEGPVPGRVRANASFYVYRAIPHKIEVSVTEEEIFKKARELGVPETVVFSRAPESELISKSLASIVAFEKLEREPYVGKELDNSVVYQAGRFRSLLEEVS